MKKSTDLKNMNRLPAAELARRTADSDRAEEAQAAAALRGNSARSGYAGRKKRTNLSLDAQLVEIATRYFPRTRFRSLSGFVEAALRQACRRDAKRLRAAGFTLPSSLFTKSPTRRRNA